MIGGWIGVNVGTVSGNAFATQGQFYYGDRSIDVSHVRAIIAANGANQVFKAIICTIDSSHNITGTVGSSTTTYTSAGTETVQTEFAFSADVTLAANTRYVIAIVRTDATGTTNARVLSWASSQAPAAVGLPYNPTQLYADNSMAQRALNYNNTSSSPTSVTLGSGNSNAQYAYQLRFKFS